MKKVKKGKGLIRSVHLQAVILIIVYFLVSNFIFLGAVTHSNYLVSFFVPLTFGILSNFAFLYLFSHKDFFHFIDGLEEEEGEKEKLYLAKFNRYGKYIACILVDWFAGPIFLALTVRFFFLESEHRYRVALISNIVPTILAVGLAKGLFNFIF